jgi:hypothetical protein
VKTHRSLRAPRSYVSGLHPHDNRQTGLREPTLSRSMDAILLTDDRDFKALPDLQVENWWK